VILENEDVLFSQASSLLETVEETVTDTNHLHQSLNRNKSLHKENLGTSETFRVKTQQKLNVLNESLTNQCNLQNQFSKSLTNKFLEHQQTSKKEYQSFKVLVDNSIDEIKSRLENVREENSSFQKKYSDNIENYKQENESFKNNTIEKLVEHNSKFENVLEGLKFALLQMEQNEQKLLSTVTQMNDEMMNKVADLKTKQTENLSDLQIHINSFCSKQLVQVEQASASTDETVNNQAEMRQNLKENFVSSFKSHFDNFAEEYFGKLFSSQHKQLIKDTDKTKLKLMEHVDSVKTLKENIDHKTLSSKDEIQKQVDEIDFNLQDKMTGFNQIVAKGQTCIKAMQGGHVDLDDKQKVFDQQIISDVENNCLKISDKFEDIENNVKTFIDSNVSAFKDISMKSDHFVMECNTKVIEQGISLQKKFTEDVNSKVDDHLNVYNEWTEQSTSAVNSINNNIVEFIEEDLKRDNPTGLTPNQKAYTFPRTLHRTEEHDKIIEDYRSRHGIPPLPPMSEEETTQPENVLNDGSFIEDSPFESSMNDEEEEEEIVCDMKMQKTKTVSEGYLGKENCHLVSKLPSSTSKVTRNDRRPKIPLRSANTMS